MNHLPVSRPVLLHRNSFTFDDIYFGMLLFFAHMVSESELRCFKHINLLKPAVASAFLEANTASRGLTEKNRYADNLINI